MKKWIIKHKAFCLIIVIAFILRLHHLTYPVLDWHSWRQADTASVTREYIKKGIDLLRPTYHDLSNIPSGKDNSANGYRMVEFPLFNALIALLVRTFSFLPLVETSRILCILASLGTICSLYLLVEKVSNKKIAILTAFTAAVLPFNVYYSRTILPEPLMLFFSTSSIYFFYLFLEKKKTKYWLTSVLFHIMAILLKPFAAFLFPVYLYLSVKKYKKNIFKQTLIILYPILIFMPFFAWRSWISQFPEGIPANKWLLNGDNIRLKPDWFRWIFFERLTKIILGFFGPILLIANLKERKKDFPFYLSWWIGVILYFIVVAKGNVQHDYYQNLMIPILCISIGRGSYFFYHWLKKKLNKNLAIINTICIYGLMLFFSYNGFETKIDEYITKNLHSPNKVLGYLAKFHLSFVGIKGYYGINHYEYVDAGDAVDILTPPNSKVIAPSFGDTMFLFQTNRTGWPIGYYIDEKISFGATHYVSTDMDDEANELMSQYEIIEKNDKFVLIDLRKPLKNPN